MENENNNEKELVTKPQTSEVETVPEEKEATEQASNQVEESVKEEREPEPEPEPEQKSEEEADSPPELEGKDLTEKKEADSPPEPEGKDLTEEEEADSATEPEGEKTPKDAETPSMENFEKLVEDSFRQPKEGEIIQGTVIRVGKENVMVDIGYKSEGQVPISEFLDRDGNVTVEPSDEIDVLIERREDENGIILLSKEKADKVRVWEEVEKLYESHTPVEGTIVGKVKGGMTVDIGVRAFLPGSQLDLRPIRNHDAFIGTKGRFEILKFNQRRGNVVVSRRTVLEKDRLEKREKTLDMIEKGRIMPGLVKNVVDYGAFIDLGGIDGLLHITDMSWGRIKHPADLLKMGQEIKVVVLKFDRESERVSLGLKQITPDPWDTAEEKYPVGMKINGKVVSITDYGAFVELEEGVEGLIHVSEMSWTRRVRHPSKIVQAGQEVEVMVLDVNINDRRISLGLKQVEPNPWDVVSEKYPSGSIIKGKIRNITDFGIFIGVEEGIDGLVHISDISWTKRIRHPGELFKKGQEIEAVVLNIDKETERFSLGVKQLTKDPWEDIRERMRPGNTITGKVVNATDFGVFLELEEGIEGLIHVSELGLEKGKSPLEVFKPGTNLTVEILNIDPNERKIRLSLKAVEEKTEKEEMRQYTASARSNGTVKIADVLGDKLTSKLKVAEETPDTREASTTEEAQPPSTDESETSDEDNGETVPEEKTEEKAEEASLSETEGDEIEKNDSAEESKPEEK